MDTPLCTAGNLPPICKKRGAGARQGLQTGHKGNRRIRRCPYLGPPIESARWVYGHEIAALDGLSAFATQAAKPGCCKLAAALSYHKLFMVYTMRNAMSLNSKAIVSSRGQVVIPRALREKLGIHAGEEIFFYVRHDGEIELKRLTRSIEQFCGRCKRVNETMPAIDTDAAIAQAVIENDLEASRKESQ